MELNIKQELAKADGVNIYRLYWEEGVHTIKILGYIYYSDHYPNNEDYRHVEFCWYDMPVDTYLTGGVSAWDEWECEHKQYIEDCTEENAYEILKGYNASVLEVYDITDETPDGVYINGVSTKYLVSQMPNK